MTASILNVASALGYPTLFLLVMAESGGVPVPGETALVTGALLATQHKLNIAGVIGIASSAAIIGDNIGYLIGRRGGRWLLERPGLFSRSRRRVLDRGIPFFERYGAPAVFFGRWMIGLRTWASWLAGATRMPWRKFAIWNAAGGVGWATTIGLIAYFAGSGSKNFLATFGIYGIVGTGISLLAAVQWRHHHQHPVPVGHSPSSRVQDRTGHGPPLERGTRVTRRG